MFNLVLFNCKVQKNVFNLMKIFHRSLINLKNQFNSSLFYLMKNKLNNSLLNFMNQFNSNLLNLLNQINSNLLNLLNQINSNLLNLMNQINSNLLNLMNQININLLLNLMSQLLKILLLIVNTDVHIFQPEQNKNHANISQFKIIIFKVHIIQINKKLKLHNILIAHHYLNWKTKATESLSQKVLDLLFNNLKSAKVKWVNHLTIINACYVTMLVNSILLCHVSIPFILTVSKVWWFNVKNKINSRLVQLVMFHLCLWKSICKKYLWLKGMLQEEKLR